MTQDTLIHKIAPTDSTILILGKTGTGKTHLAKQIHLTSPRKSQQFVSINVATLNENLLESELFGHEKGAFSGADCRRTGKLELANKGSVFLDEIGELSLKLQTKLLDFLNNKTISPVGSNRTINLNVRVIAATNKNLKKMVEAGTFREDLYYRLNIFQLKLLPIYKDQNKVKALVIRFIKEQAIKSQKEMPLICESFMEKILDYKWPGNIRELKNAIEFSYAISDKQKIAIEHLPDYITKKIVFDKQDAIEKSFSESCYPVCFHESKAIFEKKFIESMLKRFQGKINMTARETKISKVTLLDKIKKYQIDVQYFKYFHLLEANNQTNSNYTKQIYSSN